MSGVIELGGGSTTAKAISLDNVDFAIDGEVPLASTVLKWCSIPVVVVLIVGVV